jgi:hypothetical protein
MNRDEKIRLAYERCDKAIYDLFFRQNTKNKYNKKDLQDLLTTINR